MGLSKKRQRKAIIATLVEEIVWQKERYDTLLGDFKYQKNRASKLQAQLDELIKPEKVIPEGSFHIQVGRDATQYYGAIVKEDSLEAAKAKLSRYGYQSPEDTKWEDEGTDSFDRVEVCVITSPDGSMIRYTEQSGWEDITE